VTTHSPSTGQEIQNCLGFLKDEANAEKTILTYPIGRQVGLRDLKTNTMKFLGSPTNEDFIEITAIGYSYSRKYIAVGFIKKLKNDKKAYVAVHNVKNAGQKIRMQLVIDL
jgi:hypothetical protein